MKKSVVKNREELGILLGLLGYEGPESGDDENSSTAVDLFRHRGDEWTLIPSIYVQWMDKTVNQTDVKNLEELIYANNEERCSTGFLINSGKKICKTARSYAKEKNMVRVVQKSECEDYLKSWGLLGIWEMAKDAKPASGSTE